MELYEHCKRGISIQACEVRMKDETESMITISPSGGSNGSMSDEHQRVGVGERRRRGRPCAQERQNNALLQAQFTSLLTESQLDVDSDFARLNILPFIRRRERRARANDRERTRMQTLNEALDVLKSCLPPLDYFGHTDVIATKSSGQRHCTSSVKLTKIDILRLAAKYIQMLTQMLSEIDSCCTTATVDYPSSSSSSSAHSLSPSYLVSAASSCFSPSGFYPPNFQSHSNYSIYTQNHPNHNHTTDSFY